MVSLDALWNELKATYQRIYRLLAIIHGSKQRTLEPLIKTSSLLRFLARFIKNIGKNLATKSLKSVICYQEMRLSLALLLAKKQSKKKL